MNQLMIVLGLIGLFCLAVGIRDVRRKDYAWATLAFIAVGLILVTRIPSSAIMLDLPVEN